MTLAENATEIGEIWTGTNFDSQNLTSLISVISTASNGFKNTATAQDVRTANNTKDLVVTIGGLKWMVTYVSGATYSSEQQDAGLVTENDVLVTFWLAENSLGTCVWSGGGWRSNTNTVDYPSNFYSTSYIRARMNGTAYKIGYTDPELTNKCYTTNSDDVVFYKTMPASTSYIHSSLTSYTQTSLSGFIVEPKYVGWQQDYAYGERSQLGENYNFPNSILNTTSTNFYSKTASYPQKDGYIDWGNDKLWLPSLAETGYNSNKVGIWCLSNAQRSANAYSWLRSGAYGYCFDVYTLRPAEALYYSYDVARSYIAIRPAFHLNLSTAAKTIGINLLTTPAHGVVVDVLMPTAFTLLSGFLLVYFVVKTKKKSGYSFV